STAAKPTPGWTFTPAPVPTVKGNLDGHWDRRMAKGGVQPDVTIDLHGHTLASAYARLDLALGQAVAADMRLMLLITGKARAPETGRGAIRAAVLDWLASSRHAGDIAAVRNAHPRHGGDGALYIVLRRRRG
ncbi:Smr/MutS family protein, partial [Erythrobacter donghaensis]